MKILLTGAAGFIGSNWARTLINDGHDVFGVDRLEYFESRPEMSGISFRETIDMDRLFERIEAGEKFEAVLHLGACSDTMETDASFLKRVNTDYTKTLWKFCTKENIPFIYASSAATYGAGELGYNDEDNVSSLKPLNLYGQSKQDFDLWALKQSASPPNWYGLKFFNVYGFGERHKKRMASVVLHAYDQIKKAGSVKLFRSHNPDFEDGRQKRDFVSVTDTVKVMQFLLEGKAENGIYNLGTGKARTFEDLALAVFSSLGVEPKIEFIDTPESIREKYQYFTEATMSKLQKQGYERSFLSLEEGVLETVKALQSQSLQ